MFSLITAGYTICLVLSVAPLPVVYGTLGGGAASTNPRGLYEQAAKALAAGDHETACSSLRQLLTEFPDDSIAPLAASALAGSLRNQKQSQGVVECLEKWLPRIDRSELMTKRYSEQQTQSHLHYALALEELGRDEDAMNGWKELAGDRFPSKVRLLSVVHRTGIVLKRDPRTALETAREINTLSSQLPPELIADTRLGLAQSFLLHKQTAEALALLDETELERLPAAKRVSTMFLRSECLLTLHRYPEAASLLDQLLIGGTGEASAEARLNWVMRRCEIALLMHEPAKVKTLTSELKLPESTPERRHDLEVLLGRAAIEDVRFDEARVHFEQAANIAKERRLPAAGKAAWFIGETYFFARDFASAVQAYTSAVEEFPKSEWTAAALLQRGKCRELLGDHSTAEQDYRMIVEQFGASSWTKWAQERLDAIGSGGLAAGAKPAAPLR